MWFYSCLLLIVLCSSNINGARILAYLPLPTWSHYMQYEPLYDALIQKGHEMVMYSPFPPKQNRTNFTHHLTDNPFFTSLLNSFSDLNQFIYESKSVLEEARISYNTSIQTNKDILKHPTFIGLMNSSQKFDLVLLESFFVQETTVLLSHRFNCPVIQLNSVAVKFDILDAMGSPNDISIMPDLHSFYSDEMNFVERIQNMYVALVRYASRKLRYRELDRMAQSHFGSNFPSIESLLQSVSISFLYSSPSLEYTYPKVPSIIEVGGLHIPQKEPPLPDDLKKILDEAKNGFIFFSLGSVLKPKNIPEELTNTILQVFSTFKQFKFIWTWLGDKPVQNLPTNIIERKWFPQRAILAHTNCKLFITHGGMSSQLESVYYGVPMITIPYYFDQFKNAAKGERFGLGVSIYPSNLTKESLEWAIRTVTSDKKFKENVSKRSQILRDLPLTPLETAVYWVEYVLRYRGASHFQSAARKLYWFQYYFVDVLVFVLCSFVVLIFGIAKIIILLKRKIKGGKAKLKTN